MARMGTTIDKKTGRRRKVDVKRSRAAKKGARKRHGRKLKPATKRKIAMGVKRANKSHRTKAGRRTLNKRGPGRPRKHRGPGRRPGFSHSPATRKKMAAAHRARWKTHGARYRKAHKARARSRR